MRALFRLVVTIISSVSTLYFAFWMGGALVSSVGLPPMISLMGALPAAIAVARFVWTRTAAFQPGLKTSILLGALGTGGIGFSAGFFGPIFFMPDANQGPLLGLFITGPLGFVLGALGGGAHWLAWGRRAKATSGGTG